MFTGLIQGLGRLHTTSSDKLQVTCLPATSGRILSDIELGDSISVDGVCLTVVEILAAGFVADISPETLSRSTLGRADSVNGAGGQGAIANLETSLRVGSKVGGHFVSGHVDGLGSLRESVETAAAWEMTFATLSESVARYIVPKGSIAVNGISLTIADCDPAGSWFTVAVIPHTYAETNLHCLEPGGQVNLEGDILGKYVEKFLGLKVAASPPSKLHPDNLNPDFLLEHGYL